LSFDRAQVLGSRLADAGVLRVTREGYHGRASVMLEIVVAPAGTVPVCFVPQSAE
jgi:hypothetical protein